MEAKETPRLFDLDKEWEKEWIGMPEFLQGKQKPYSQVIVRFSSEKDLLEFSKLIDQSLTNKTKSIWFPARSHWGGIGGRVRWVDES